MEGPVRASERLSTARGRAHVVELYIEHDNEFKMEIPFGCILAFATPMSARQFFDLRLPRGADSEIMRTELVCSIATRYCSNFVLANHGVGFGFAGLRVRS